MIDAKVRLFGFVKFLELSRNNVSAKVFTQFEWLKKCTVTNRANRVICEHMERLIVGLNERFNDLKILEIPS